MKNSNVALHIFPIPFLVLSLSFTSPKHNFREFYIMKKHEQKSVFFVVFILAFESRMEKWVASILGGNLCERVREVALSTDDEHKKHENHGLVRIVCIIKICSEQREELPLHKNLMALDGFFVSSSLVQRTAEYSHHQESMLPSRKKKLLMNFSLSFPL